MTKARQLTAHLRFTLTLTLLVIGAGLLAPGAMGGLIEAPLRVGISMVARCGWAMEWQDGGIRIGQVHVPWSEECSGI